MCWLSFRRFCTHPTPPALSRRRLETLMMTQDLLLLDGSMGFGGEESAGATFLRRDGSVWTTDKDGIVPALLSAAICTSYLVNGRAPVTR